MSEFFSDLKKFDYLPEAIEGKNILITGGTTGIGRTTALLLASEGAHVMIFGRHKKELQDALNNFRDEKLSDRVHGFTADVAKEKDIKKIFQEVDERFKKLDILINNAGLGFGGIMEGGYEDWHYIMNTNLLGYVACAREAVDRMKEHRNGHIVNIGSMSADARRAKETIYAATKSGVQGFSEALSKEVNPLGIRVTLIEPGAVGADMQEESPKEQRKLAEEFKMLKTEDIAACLLYVLTQPKRCNIASMQIRPLLQVNL